MMDAGLLVSVNSDDPAYFGGYVADNYRALQSGLGLDDGTLVNLARNSIRASFLDDARKKSLIAELEALSSGDEG
jgi:adenosine deaminase